jgi:sulfonate transport system substrate-binding protein
VAVSIGEHLVNSDWISRLSTTSWDTVQCEKDDLTGRVFPITVIGMRHRPRRTLLAVPLSAALLLAAAGCGAGGDGSGGGGGAGGESAAGDGEIPAGTTLRVADQGHSLETLLTLSGEADDLPYDLRYANFMGGPAVNEAFAAGEVDLGTMGDTPAINNLAAGLGTVAIATTVSDGQGAAVYAREDSGIDALEDIEGHSVAFQSGTNTHGFLLRALDSVGLDQSDIDPVDVPLTDLPTVVGGGDAETGVIYEFARHDFLADQPDAVELVTFSELVPVYNFLVATREAIDDEARGAALEDFVVRYARAYQWAAEHRDEWVEQFYVENLGQSPEAARDVADATGTVHVVEITDEVRDDLQEQADLLLEVDELPDEVDLGDLFPDDVAERFNAALAGLAEDPDDIAAGDPAASSASSTTAP